MIVVMSSTQPNLASNIKTETISIKLLHSFKGDTPTNIIKLCFHGNTLFPVLLVRFQNFSEFQLRKIKPGQVIYPTHLYGC